MITLLAVRIWDSQRGPPLELWHTFVPVELSADELDQADWGRYLAAEQAAFDEVQAEVTQSSTRGPRSDQPLLRGQPGLSGAFRAGLEPLLRAGAGRRAGRRRGAAARADRRALQPASHRRALSDHGFVAIVPRLPAHGTVPAALTEVEWEDWMAATRLAVREARARVGPDLPLHLVGFSNGGALAMKYALDAHRGPGSSRGPTGWC